MECSRFSSFLEKALVSRVRHRFLIHIIKFCRSTKDVESSGPGRPESCASRSRRIRPAMSGPHRRRRPVNLVQDRVVHLPAERGINGIQVGFQAV